MDCERVQNFLADGALGRVLPTRVKDHVEHCGDCLAELDRLESAVALIGHEINAGLAVETPPELVARVRQRVAETAPNRRPLLVWAGALVAVLALVVLSVRLIAPPSPQPQSAQAEQMPREAPSEPPREVATPTAMIPEPLEVSRPIPATEPEPAVLVAPGQLEAIVAYYRRVSRGEIDSPSLEGKGPLEELAEASAVTIPALQLTPVRIRPIKIEPIDLEERR